MKKTVSTWRQAEILLPEFERIIAYIKAVKALEKDHVIEIRSGTIFALERLNTA